MANVVDLISVFLSVVDKAMDLIPDYSQRKRKMFYSLRRAYEQERAKGFGERDDNLIGIYRDELTRFMDVFGDDLAKYKEEQEVEHLE